MNLLVVLLLMALQENQEPPPSSTPLGTGPPALRVPDGSPPPDPDGDTKKKKKKHKKQDQEGELPGAVRPTPEEVKGKKKPKKEDYQVDFRVGLWFEYNDNIIRLDKKDLEAFDSGSNPQKFRISSPGDFIYSPWGEADMALHVFGEPSTAGLRVTGHLYQINSFASNEALSAFLKSKDYNIEYTYEPNIYRREYRNLDTGLYESAFYDDHLFAGALKFPIEKWVLLRPKIGVEIRDYHAPFQYRSSVAPFVSPRAVLTLWKEIEPFIQYDFEWNNAFATGVQPDTSYYQNGVEVGAFSRVVRGLEMELKYRFEHRVYTTTNDPSFDPSHAGRTDDRSRIVARAVWKLLPTLNLEASYAHWVTLSNIPGKPDLTDEDSNWRRNEYMLGVAYSF
jgi:hypothetical protein